MNTVITVVLLSETYRFRYAEKFFRILDKMTELQISCDYATVMWLLNYSTEIQIYFFAVRYE